MHGRSCFDQLRMQSFKTQCGATIRYATRGTGPTNILLLAPGGMESALDKWGSHPYDPWTSLPAEEFRIIGMDQRNSNEETASPLGIGWESYREDQLALLDQLGASQCLLVGSCIGPSFALALMKHSPERFPAAVLLQPIGLARHTTESVGWEGFNSGTRRSFVTWSERMIEKGRFDASAMNELHESMYGGGRDFVFSASREDLISMDQPMLVFMGKDRSHPSETSREVARLAPNASLVEQWRDEHYVADVVDQCIINFLRQHAQD